MLGRSITASLVLMWAPAAAAAEAAGCNLQGVAQRHFRQLIQAPETNSRLKELLGEVISNNRAKSRAEIVSIFEQRKKEFAQTLQQQALAAARKQCDQSPSLHPN